MGQGNPCQWNGALWGPAGAPNQNTNKPRKKHIMPRLPFFPRTQDARPEWFGTYATQLNSLGAGIGLDPVAVAASVKRNS